MNSKIICSGTIATALAGLSLAAFASTVQMPVECTNPDGMCVDAKDRLVIAAPNNDHRRPGAVFRLDAPGAKPYLWFEVPPNPASGYAAPMGVCFGPEGELYVCDNQNDSQGRLLRIAFTNDRVASCEAIAVGLSNANGVKYLRGKLYLTQAFLSGVKRADGASTSGLYMFDARDRGVRVRNDLSDSQCVFSDITRNPNIKGGLNGVAIDPRGRIYTGNYGDGHVWRLTPGADGRIAKSERILEGGAGIVTPDGMCVDAAGTVYVADMRGDALVVLDENGRPRCVRKGGFTRPSEPCAWRGSVYVANYGGTTLERVTP